MIFKHTLLVSFSITLLSVASSTITMADNNSVVFPSDISVKQYQYPPQTPVPPQLRRPKNVAPYSYRQRLPQQRMMPAQPQTPRFYRAPVRPQRSFVPTNPRVARPNNSFSNRTNNFPMNNNNFIPFGNSNANNRMPFANSSFGMPNNPMNNMFGNNNSFNNFPFFNSNTKKRKKAWGDKRNIWPDFYTDFTDDAWDTMMSGPRDLGKMPGGWRFPYISMPDPVTVSDAITNQLPPIAEEAANMADFSDWGVFDNK